MVVVVLVVVVVLEVEVVVVDERGARVAAGLPVPVPALQAVSPRATGHHEGGASGAPPRQGEPHPCPQRPGVTVTVTSLARLALATVRSSRFGAEVTEPPRVRAQ